MPFQYADCHSIGIYSKSKERHAAFVVRVSAGATFLKWAARMEVLPEAPLQRMSFENINMETEEGVSVKWVEEVDLNDFKVQQ